jgi:hypothetical protein
MRRCARTAVKGSKRSPRLFAWRPPGPTALLMTPTGRADAPVPRAIARLMRSVERDGSEGAIFPNSVIKLTVLAALVISMERSPRPPPRPITPAQDDSLAPADHQIADLGHLASNYPFVVLLTAALFIITMIIAYVSRMRSRQVPRTLASPWARKGRTPRQRRPPSLSPLPGGESIPQMSTATWGSDCRWRKDAFRVRKANFIRWVCLECDAEGYRRDGQPPSVCKRGLKPRAI